MKPILLVLVPAFAGCRTLETRSVAGAPPPAVRVGARARAWEVRLGDERLGHVVQFQERGLASDSVYVVRNAWNQDLGLIDGLGRAYRYVPHMEEPAWVGSGTIALGAERILGVTGCTLVPLESASESSPEIATDESAQCEALDPTARPSNAPLVDGGLPQSR